MYARRHAHDLAPGRPKLARSRVNQRWHARFDTIRRRLDRLEQFAFAD